MLRALASSILNARKSRGSASFGGREPSSALWYDSLESTFPASDLPEGMFDFENLGLMTDRVERFVLGFCREVSVVVEDEKGDV